MTSDEPVFVVAVFTADGPLFTPDGTPSISGTVDFHAMMTAVPGGEGGHQLVSTYRDPDVDPGDIADLLARAAEQFRAPAAPPTTP